MRKLRTGDQVIVITGKSKGKIGHIIKVVDDSKVVVEGVAVAKKNVRANPSTGEFGGVVDKLMPIDISNVAIWNSELKKADRVAFRFENGEKVRVFKSNGKVLNTGKAK